MKHFSLSKLAAITLFAFAASLFANAANAADTLTINATLILGSNDGGGVDSSLKRYEHELKKNIPQLDTFKQLGASRAAIASPGSSTISLRDENNLSVNVEPTGNGQYRISYTWKQKGQTVYDITVRASKNKTTVLVGPSSGGGRLILHLVAI